MIPAAATVDQSATTLLQTSGSTKKARPARVAACIPDVSPEGSARDAADLSRGFEGLHELVLRHVGAALDVELLRALVELVLRELREIAAVRG